MSYTVKYEGTVREKDTKALASVKGWFGDKLSVAEDSLLGSLMHGYMTHGRHTKAAIDYCHFVMSFGGVQGYPVKAMIRQAFTRPLALVQRGTKLHIAFGKLPALLRMTKKMVANGNGNWADYEIITAEEFKK